MAIIVVGGSANGAGKTSLICALIATHDNGQATPVWEETHAGYDSDTQSYLRAGAARSFLLTAAAQPESPEPDLAQVLDEFWPNFGPGTNLIFESNRVVHYVRPDVCLLIHAMPRRDLFLPPRKPSFMAALEHADAMVANSSIDDVIPDGLTLPGQLPKPVFWLSSLRQVSPQLLAWTRPLVRLPVLDPFLHS
jgi:hypothetical protein